MRRWPRQEVAKVAAPKLGTRRQARTQTEAPCPLLFENFAKRRGSLEVEKLGRPETVIVSDLVLGGGIVPAALPVLLPPLQPSCNPSDNQRRCPKLASAMKIRTMKDNKLFVFSYF